ncbi:selenocysteine-specific translation elongation factor [Pigmentiphaga soli]|uniref:Selenocysteine-specific elongation factor n=1 Tax=Pigmentiphaga soli TaxID=1007095 RepID=A0ABP8GF93_9BURK
MIIGTAGHIDHGKTTLVRALTGVDTDRLKEEKRRGISIELGYAYTPLPDGSVLGIVDVPGHEKLIHTMAAGATGIDFALLVIAADDGVMPQTREHLAILDLLGVRRGAVAVTKADRVDAARRDEVAAQIRSLLAPTPLAGAPLFFTDATQAGDPGVQALRARLHEAAMAMRARADDGLFRLAVDRVFTLAGQGTVVTGTVHGGRVRVGDTVRVSSSGASVRIRGIHAQNRQSETGSAGQRCALNLAGIDKTAIARGDWIADPRALRASPRIDARLRLLDGAPLKQWSALHVHLGTAHQLAHVLALADGPGADGTMRAQLVFDRPVFALPGDRFIVRDAQAAHTIGGGTVIDPLAPDRRRRSAERMAYLDAIECALGLCPRPPMPGTAADAGTDADADTGPDAYADPGARGNSDGLPRAGRAATPLARIDLMPILARAPHGMARSELALLAGRAPEHLELDAGVIRIPARDAEGQPDQRLIAAGAWQALRDRITEALAQFHQRFPDEQGPNAARLQRMALPAFAGPEHETFRQGLVDALLREGAIARSGAWLHLADHAVVFSDEERALAGRLTAALADGGFDPPWVRDLARDLLRDSARENEVRRLLRKLARAGEVFQVVNDLFYSPARIAELAHTVATLAAASSLPGHAVEARQFRDATGLGRKRAIQILEFFDRVGYTRRTSTGHAPRADSPWQVPPPHG